MSKPSKATGSLKTPSPLIIKVAHYCVGFKNYLWIFIENLSLYYNFSKSLKEKNGQPHSLGFTKLHTSLYKSYNTVKWANENWYICS